MEINKKKFVEDSLKEQALMEELEIIKNICAFNFEKEIPENIRKDFLRISILIDSIIRKENK